MSVPVHVVSKSDNAHHVVYKISEENILPMLASSSVRARACLISLSSNNLSYARGGKSLHWWDTFPLPDASSPEYKDSEKWGIVPAWGYGCVTNSSIDAIKPGSLLWGFWPTSLHSVDIELRALEPTGHWQATNDYRQSLMSVYNRYKQTTSSEAAAMKMAALCEPVWEAGYCLNHGVFSNPGIHPLGSLDLWSEADSDLTSAVVISVSASSKTGRSFSWELARDRDVSKHGPLALLQLTSVPEMLPHYSDSKLSSRAARYGDPTSMPWVERFKPSRIVIVDFGGPGDVLNSLHEAVSTISPNVTIIAVGFEAKVYTNSELESRMAQSSTLGKIQLNTSGLRDRLIELSGPEKYFSQQEQTWNRCYREGGLGEIQVKTLNSVEGPDGIEGAWRDLCTRKVLPDVGIVIDLSQDTLYNQG